MKTKMLQDGKMIMKMTTKKMITTMKEMMKAMMITK